MYGHSMYSSHISSILTPGIPFFIVGFNGSIQTKKLTN